jgi:hypothetical protein
VNGRRVQIHSRVNQQLGQELRPADLVEHYADDAFENIPSVEEMRHEADHFRIVTGRFTHFLLPMRNSFLTARAAMNVLFSCFT